MVVEGMEASANCTYVAFPNHTQKGRRTKCNEPLMRLVKLSNGDEKLYPYRLYCYKPITESIKDFCDENILFNSVTLGDNEIYLQICTLM